MNSTTPQVWDYPFGLHGRQVSSSLHQSRKLIHLWVWGMLKCRMTELVPGLLELHGQQMDGRLLGVC